MGSITDATILHHVCIVLVLLWGLNSFESCHPIAYFIALIYLYLIHEGYVTRLRKKLQFEEKREANQRRVLTDSETVRWLNHAVEKIWPICMEKIVSQKILLPMVPWFLKKYKPWTVKDAEIQHLYLGRSPPIITEIRVLRQSNDDDHLVLELGLNFRTADDMSAVIAAKLRKRLGFGMWTKLHMLGMHVEGKVLVGVKFIRKWPFIGRLRVCFAGPPYFQMTVKPIFTHGLDVTELPGIAGWIDNLLALVFEQTLVEPNMLVVDVEKFASPDPGENWFSVDAKEPIANALVEVLEAADMNPSDLNGLADPYVKGRLGPYRFRTKTHKKTLAPKWQEEFKIPICTWESQNTLEIEVRDKDHLFDDMMGDCCINLNEFRDGQRHDIWLPLKNIKMGRLHLAVTVSEETIEFAEEFSHDAGGLTLDNDSKRTSFAAADSVEKSSFSSRTSDKSTKIISDKFEPIDIEGQSETGIWIHHPGSEVTQLWEPRKGKNSRSIDIQRTDSGSFKSNPNDGSSTDESVDANNKSHSKNPVKKGLRKFGSVFRRSPRTEENKYIFPDELEPSPRYNIKATNAKEVGVRFIVDDEKESREDDGPESPSQMKGMAKSIMKHAGKSARGLKMALSRKSSRKFKDEAVPESSSDVESRSSTEIPVLETGLGVPGPGVPSPGSASGNNSFKSSFKRKDSVVQTAAADSGNNSVKSSDDTTKSGDGR